MRRLSSYLVVLSLAMTAQQVSAAEWSQFRGPNNSGLSAADAKGLPAEWGTDKNIHWKVVVPGAAWSCPIVWGNRIFVTTAITEKQVKPKAGRGGFGGRGGGGFGGGGGGGDGYGPPEGGPGPDQKGKADRKPGNPEEKTGAESDRKTAEKSAEDSKDGEPRRGGGGSRGRGGRGGGMGGRRFGGSGGPPPDVLYRWEIHCLDRETGKTLWQKIALERKPTIPTHSTNTFASETPVTDGERVYAYFGMHGLFCYDVNGKELWKKDLGSFPMVMGWGTGSSPALEGDRLFIQCDNEKESFLVALDKKSGDELWRVKRDSRSSWSTPFVWHNKGRTEIVACGGNYIRSYNPTDGKLLWEMGGLTGSSSATPVADEEMLYIGSGGPNNPKGPLFAIKAGANGDITLKGEETSNSGVGWSRTKAGPRLASPLLYQGLLYVIEQQGGSTISCYDAKTGEPKFYRKRVNGARGFTSSPWAADGKVFCLDDSGNTFVLKAGPEFEVIGENTLQEMCWSTPALTTDAILLRGVDHLYCIKK